MRLLLVEDDRELARALSASIREVVPRAEIQIATSRDAAYEALAVGKFDLAICDLKLPTRDGTLDEDVVHGLAVRPRVEEAMPGTPVLILSAFGTVDLLTSLLREARREDIFGDGTPVPMIDFVQKSNLPNCVERVQGIARQLGVLDDIEIATGGINLGLEVDHERVLRIFGRRHRGRVIRVTQLGGGLSASKVLRVRVNDSAGTMRALAVAKVDDWRTIRDERERYRRSVAPLLGPANFIPEMDVVQAGAADLGGIFYTLADEYDRSLFGLLRADPAAATQIVRRLREIEEPWRVGAPLVTVRVRDIRRLLMSDEASGRIEEAREARQEFEDREVHVRQCHQHGDLHGLNVLTTANGQAVLIDYGEVTDNAPPSLDPIVLELSLVFHPAAAAIRGDWPTVAVAQAWANLEAYLHGCPVPGFVRACREWAFAVSAGDREVYAIAYAFAVRQLKYADTDHALAEAIARAAIDAFVR